MSIFRKKQEEKSCCNCAAEVSAKTESAESTASVKILGSGCKKCNELEANVIEALRQLGMDTAVEHIKDFSKIAEYGVMSTPAVVVDEKVLSFGKVLKVAEAVDLIKKARG